MTLSACRVFHITIIVVALNFGVGCEDSAARSRDEAQRAISELGRELQVTISKIAAVGSGEEVDQTQQKLSTIVNRLGSVSGADSAQQASRSMLAASALRELAHLHLNRADAMEAQHRQRRAMVMEQLTGIARLQAVATGVQAADTASERQQLQAQLAATKSAVTQLGNAISQLQGPINERTSQNQANQKEVDELRVRVHALLRKAQEMGHADGIETYSRAVAVGRQADKIEFDIAQREIELEYTLEPEHRLATSQVQQWQELIQAIEKAQAQLDSVSQTAASDVQSTQQHIGEISGKIASSLNELAQQIGSELQPAYDDALAALEKAISQTQAASRELKGDDLQAARLQLARIHEIKGRLYWSKARGLADQAALLQRISYAGHGAGLSVKDEDLKAAQSAHAETIEQAKAEYAAAQEAASQVQGRANAQQLEAFNRNLELAGNALEGKGAESSGAGQFRAPIQSAGARGAESPDALAAMLKSAQRPEDALAVMSLLPPLDRTPGLPPAMRGFLQAMREMIDAQASLESALQNKFGKGASDLKSSGFGKGFAAGLGSAGPMQGVVDAVVENTDGDQSSVRVTTKDGESQSVKLVRIDGRWYFDPAAFVNKSATSPEEAQMRDMMMPMMSRALGAFSRALHDIAAAVNRGDFKTFQEVEAQIDQRMAKAMQESGGGTPFPGGMTPPSPR